MNVHPECPPAPLSAPESAITVTLPLPPPECWPNHTGRLADRMSAKTAARLGAKWATQLAVNRTLPRVPAWEQVRATAVYTFNVRRTRDDDGLMSALKHYRDGIASVVCKGGKDDGWRWESIEVVVDKTKVAGVVITVMSGTTPHTSSEEE